jgi:hypothetical protein
MGDQIKKQIGTGGMILLFHRWFIRVDLCASVVKYPSSITHGEGVGDDPAEENAGGEPAMEQDSLAGLLISLGSAVFILAALLPASRAFAERRPEFRLALINFYPVSWKAAQLAFGLGAALCVAGLAVLSVYLWGAFRLPLAWIALGLAAAGAFFWLWQVLQRAYDPRGYALDEHHAWLFPVYAGLTLAGLSAYGLSLLLAGYPPWLGLLLMIAAAVLAIVYLVMKELPPVLIYTLTLVAGAALMF